MHYLGAMQRKLFWSRPRISQSRLVLLFRSSEPWDFLNNNTTLMRTLELAHTVPTPCVTKHTTYHAWVLTRTLDTHDLQPYTEQKPRSVNEDFKIHSHEIRGICELTSSAPANTSTHVKFEQSSKTREDGTYVVKKENSDYESHF